jgi:hypothetical protein
MLIAPPAASPDHSMTKRWMTHPSSRARAQEFGEAGEALGRVCAQIAAGVRSGWDLPWGVRVRVAEALLVAQFNADGSYVDVTQELSNCLARCVWPALGLGPVLQLAVNAWAHFRQFITTRDARLLRQVRRKE